MSLVMMAFCIMVVWVSIFLFLFVSNQYVATNCIIIRLHFLELTGWAVRCINSTNQW